MTLHEYYISLSLKTKQKDMCKVKKGIEELISSLRDYLDSPEDLYEILENIPISMYSGALRGGDFLATDEGCWIGIVSKQLRCQDYHSYMVYVMIHKDHYEDYTVAQVSKTGNSGPWSFSRVANPKEIRALLATIKSARYKWDPKSLQISREV